MQVINVVEELVITRSAGGITEIDLSGKPRGTYLLAIQCQGEREVIRLVKE